MYSEGKNDQMSAASTAHTSTSVLERPKSVTASQSEAVITPHEFRHLPPTLTPGPNPRVVGAIFLRQRGLTAAERGRDISSNSVKTFALNPKEMDF